MKWILEAHEIYRVRKAPRLRIMSIYRQPRIDHIYRIVISLRYITLIIIHVKTSHSRKGLLGRYFGCVVLLSAYHPRYCTNALEYNLWYSSGEVKELNSSRWMFIHELKDKRVIKRFHFMASRVIGIFVLRSTIKCIFQQGWKLFCYYRWRMISPKVTEIISCFSFCLFLFVL